MVERFLLFERCFVLNLYDRFLVFWIELRRPINTRYEGGEKYRSWQKSTYLFAPGFFGRFLDRLLGCSAILAVFLVLASDLVIQRLTRTRDVFLTQRRTTVSASSLNK